MTTTNIFDLTPDEFHQQEETERRAEQEAREAKERAEREAAEAAEHKKAQIKQAHTARWRAWLTLIGGHADGLPFEVRDTDNDHRPCELFVSGIRVPVSEGMGRGMSLEIHMPWYTAGYDNWRHSRFPVDKCVSRQKKDGSFNYEALGQMAARYAQAEINHHRDEVNKTDNDKIAKRLSDELKYRGISASVDPTKPAHFKFSMSRNMTEDNTRAAVAALRAAGLLD